MPDTCDSWMLQCFTWGFAENEHLMDLSITCRNRDHLKKKNHSHIEPDVYPTWCVVCICSNKFLRIEESQKKKKKTSWDVKIWRQEIIFLLHIIWYTYIYAHCKFINSEDRREKKKKKLSETCKFWRNKFKFLFLHHKKKFWRKLHMCPSENLYV